MWRLIALLLVVGAGQHPSLDGSQAPRLPGVWDIEFTLDGHPHRLRFRAEAGGTGSFLLRDPRSDLVEAAEPSPASWRATASAQAAFRGRVEFPIGNVGREEGTLVFRGTFTAETRLAGEVAFFASNVDPDEPAASPAKKGPFTAARVQ